MARAMQITEVLCQDCGGPPFLRGAFLCTSLNMYRDLIVHNCLLTAKHLYIFEQNADHKCTGALCLAAYQTQAL